MTKHNCIKGKFNK